MVQVIFRNVFEDATISINIKKFCNVPLSEEERSDPRVLRYETISGELYHSTGKINQRRK